MISMGLVSIEPRFRRIIDSSSFRARRQRQQPENQTNQIDIYSKNPGGAEKQLEISKYNAKLIGYNPFTNKSALWSAEGAPEMEFGRLGTVFDQCGIASAIFYRF